MGEREKENPLIVHKREKDETKETVKFRSSRKSYLFYYFMILATIVSVAYIWFSEELVLDSTIGIVAGVFVVVLIKFTEVHRFYRLYTLTPTSLEFSEGIILRNIQRLKYNSISDAGLIQSPWQRIIGTGDIMVSQFSENLVIKNINKPDKVLELIMDRI